MSEFSEANNDDTSKESSEIKDAQGDNSGADSKEEELIELEEQTFDKYEGNCKTDVENVEEITETDYDNMPEDELKKLYEDKRVHDWALGKEFVKYDKQISQISSDKAYYSEKEFNSYINEKIDAQDQVSKRRYQIQSEMRTIEKIIDNRRNNL